MRLFVAVDLDGRARAVAIRNAPALAARFDLDDEPAPLRWIALERLHCTLLFLGEMSDRQAALVCRAFRTPWETHTFEASLAVVGLFFFSGSARIVWLGVYDGLDGMVALKIELDRRLAPVAFKSGTKLFRVHLTLWRVRLNAAITGLVLRSVLGGYRPETARWVVGRVTLYESRLSFRSATYHVVEPAMLPSTRESHWRTSS